MNKWEIETVLANWIDQAINPPGRLATEVSPAQWVSTHFLGWWRPRIAEELSAAKAAIASVRTELERLGGFASPQLGESMQELTHADEALSALVSAFGLGPD